MTPAYAVIWPSKSCTTYLTPSKDWSLDPSEGEVFTSWLKARFAAGLTKGAQVVRCWV